MYIVELRMTYTNTSGETVVKYTKALVSEGCSLSERIKEFKALQRFNGQEPTDLKITCKQEGEVHAKHTYH